MAVKMATMAVEKNRTIICRICREVRRTQFWFDVCPRCVTQVEKGLCACGREFYKPDPETTSCNFCRRREAKPIIECEDCGETAMSHVGSPFCRKCYLARQKRAHKEVVKRRAVCEDCGEERDVYLKSSDLCVPCYDRRRAGDDGCSVGGCDTAAANKTHALCKRHYGDLIARDCLERYVSSYPSTISYFHLLADKIDWDSVTGTTLRRFRAFGQFLPPLDLPSELSWAYLEGVKPELQDEGRSRLKFIRSCLDEVGHELVSLGLLPPWDVYLADRRTLQPLEYAPGPFAADLAGLRQWMLEGALDPLVPLPSGGPDLLTFKPETVRKTLQMVIPFLGHCAGRGITEVGRVTPQLLADYQQTLFWQLRCPACKTALPFEPWSDTAPCAAEGCGGIPVKVIRHSRSYVSVQTSAIRLYFEWAVLHGKAESNPSLHESCKVACRTFTVRNEDGTFEEIRRGIRRYDSDVINRMCAYMVSPDSDPEAALVLYLIIFHLCTVGELRTLVVPSKADDSGRGAPGYTEADYRQLMLPRREFSLGNHSVRRPADRISFHAKAGRWLRPVLERAYGHRDRVVGSSARRYLLAGEGRACHDKPVGKDYVRRLVRRVSLEVLGAAINPWDLRRSAAAVFADTSSVRGAVLTRMGFGPTRAIQFTCLPVYTIRPK